MDAQLAPLGSQVPWGLVQSMHAPTGPHLSQPHLFALQFPQGMGPPYEGLAGSRILILDHSGNVHSMWRPEVAPTGEC